MGAKGGGVVYKWLREGKRKGDREREGIKKVYKKLGITKLNQKKRVS